MTETYESPGYFSAVLDGLSGGYGSTGLSIDPIEIYFGTMVVGESDFTPRTITVTNVGPTAIGILDVRISVGAAYFTLVSGAGYPSMLNPGHSFDIEVRASLTSTSGRVAGMLEIKTNEERKTYVVGLSGRVVAGSSWDSAISAIYADFQGRLDNEAWLRVTGDSAEVGARTTMGVSLSDLIFAQIAIEQSARVTAISAEAGIRTAMGVQLTDDLTAAISNEQYVRATQFGAEATARSTLDTNLRNEITSRVSTEQTARVNAVAAVASDLLTLGTTFTTLNGNTNVRIDDEIMARSDAFAAEATRVNNLFTALTQTGGTIDTRVTAGVNSEASARSSAVAAEASRVDALLASYSTIGSMNSTVNAAITIEADIRSTVDAATVDRIDTLEASVISGGGGGIDTFARGAIVTEAEARADEDEALASLITTLRADLTTETNDRISVVEAEVTNRNSAIADAVSAEATRIDSIVANYSTTGAMNTAIGTAVSTAVNAEIINRNSAIAGAVGAETSSRTSQIASMTTVMADVRDLLTANSDFIDWPNPAAAPAKWSPVSLARTTRVAGLNKPYAVQVNSTNTDYDTMVQGVGQSLGLDSVVGGIYVIECEITLVSGSLVDAGFFVQYYVHGTSTQLGGDYIIFNTVPLPDGTIVGAGVAGKTYRWTRLTTAVPAGCDVTAFAVTNAPFMATRHDRNIIWRHASFRRATTAEVAAMRADAVSADNAGDIITANSRIDTEITNRANAVSAEATRVDTLLANYSTTGTTNTMISAAVSSEASARALAIDGAVSAEASLRSAISTRLDGVGGAGVTVESVASTTAANNGAIASLNASYEVKVSAGGVWSGFGLRTGGVTGAFTIVNADLLMGTGHVVFDNGVVIKVLGVGFGSSNQFISWFGPKVAFAAMTEANAISYEKTNGYAYYRGGLDTGTLRYGPALNTGVGLTDTLLGPFGTNGNSKTVSVSYTRTESFGRQSSGGFSGTPTLTVNLYRRYNGGAWSSVIASVTTVSASIDRDDGLYGTASFFATSGEPFYATITYSGAITFVDTTAGIGLFEYKASIISHSGYSLSGSPYGGGGSSQTVSLYSVE